jgi:ERCC4-type nuclease
MSASENSGEIIRQATKLNDKYQRVFLILSEDRKSTKGEREKVERKP